MTKVLVLHSKQHKEISETALEIVCNSLKKSHMEAEVFSVQQFPSLPCAASMSLELYEYDGVVVLGCITQNEYEIERKIIFREVVRCFADISVHYAIPVGFGLCIFHDEAEAVTRFAQLSAEAVDNCIELIKLKTQLGYPSQEQFTRYNN